MEVLPMMVCTLRGEDGNVIRSAAEMGVKVNAGIQHSYSSDPDQWMWGGEGELLR